MREWPEKGTVRLDDLVEPLREAQQRARKGEPADYQGLGIPSFLATCTDIDETLTPDGLEYHEERGRDADTVFLTCAVQLGMEQGIRHHKAEQESMWHLLALVRTCLQAGDQRSLKLARETMERALLWAPASGHD